MAGARIYKPAKTAMQSGKAKTKNWVLEFEPSSAKRPDNLMGWTGSQDMSADQVKIRFSDKAQAIAFAKKCGIECRVQEPAERGVTPKSYADNFHPDRVPGNWTH